MVKIIRLYQQLIVRNKKWFIPISIIFVIGVVSGYSLAVNNKEETTKILAGYASSIDFKVQDGLALSLYIFERNLGIVVFSLFAGFFFGLIPLAISFINGGLLGVVFGFSEIYKGVNFFQLLMLVLPHGIFEYTGSIIGLAFGLKLGVNWLRKSASGRRKKVFLKDLNEAFLIAPLVVLILAVAALVEGNLTDKIACFVASVCR